MLKEDMLLQIFNEKTSGNNHLSGQRLVNNDLISSIDISNNEDILSIEGNVISESLFNEYHTKIELDCTELNIISTHCSCPDYELKGTRKINYCCKHLVGTFYKAVEEVASHPLLNSGSDEADNLIRNNSNVLAILLGEDSNKDEIKIEVYINKSSFSDTIYAEFRIGLKSMSSSNLYILKDVNQFLSAYHNNIPIEYSKNFIFYTRRQALSTEDKRVIDFIEVLKSLERKNPLNKNGGDFIDGKFINLPAHLVREFFTIIKNHRVYLNEGFFSRPVETEILFSEPAIEFDLKNIKDMYVLKAPEGMPISLSKMKDVLLFGTTIYMPNYEYCYKLNPYLAIFNQAKVITIPKLEEETIFKRLIPDLNLLTPRVTLSKDIQAKIVISEVEFSFYFDRENSNITLIPKVKYGPFEFNIFEDFQEKIIYRDSKKEQQVISTIKNLGFETHIDRFYLTKGDDYVFRFFKSEINRLQMLGEVYYSENFKGIKTIGSKGIQGSIRTGKYNYFEMDFKIDDIPKSETAHILRAFRDKLKYYKLVNGEYLDLEELELKQFLKLLDVVSTKGIKDNHIEMPKSKGVFVHSYLEDNKLRLRYLEGKSVLKELSSKLKNIEKLEFKEPLELQGTLRAYQKIGYNWFKTMEYLGFGGILGDEMGLGKTLQTISFILGSKGRKSLIITPTSLIYNWISEFESFAPTVAIIAVNGSKSERDKILSNIGNYDVLITTYNLLKRDITSYKELEFDYCILDEAQYIKNAHSQNAITVKEIRSKTRFALSGTPIENSLMELWSIFDFIMPGYLYDEKRFSVRYNKRLNEGPEILEEINRLVKPFILRRTKKDVLKELPDKIEKKLVVSMEDEQTKVYKTYAKYALDLIEKKVEDEEFTNSKIEILAYITKLRQICLDPSVVMEDYIGGSGKIEALVELLHKGIGEGHRVLVFSQFTTVLKNVKNRMISEGISFSYLDGTISAEKRMGLVNAFNEGDTSVFLISLKAGGMGINLTSADLVIHFDPWWNPAVENQATDRAHRIGQRKVVEVVKIIAKGTIEEKILLLQEEKKKLISELMDNELSSGDSLKALTQEELLGLFEVAK